MALVPAWFLLCGNLFPCAAALLVEVLTGLEDCFKDL